ncbi:MAG: MBOAT family protein [Planctomycetota bacterium]|nr:MAG: MBOAT family protein [Planctomycetota bacterium]
MLFTELRFLPFFLLVLAGHWLVRHQGWRKLWLLAASYAFYAAWDWRFLSLILASTGADLIAGHRIHAARAAGRRGRPWLLFSLVVNLGLLGFFKYFHFFVDSGVALLGWLGIPAGAPALSIVLPVGISFYTFQTMSYTLDIWRGRLAPARSPLDLALFVAFFPQLVAGPIVRAADFLPQLERPRRWAEVAVRPALLLFLAGYLKKACISDNLAPWVDAYFADPAAYGAAAAWQATVGYAVQIYCDFSGYSDMAIACAALLGYRLGRNFDFPYFAVSIRDFWRRWHISLSTWLRDYLYIPLGGNRGSRWFQARNLMVTMLLGGLWHGAAWTFVVWGGLHGLALVAHRVWERAGLRLPAVAGWLLTFWFACVCWIFFRAASFADAWTALGSFVLFRAPGDGTLAGPGLPLLAALLAAHGAARFTSAAEALRRLPAPLFGALLGAAAALALAFTPVDYHPFIYFQF